MEEGKRMFSIFAARMFEQRVLNAYRERVAQERQLQLLRELEDEDKLTKEREAKKQSQNHKKRWACFFSYVIDADHCLSPGSRSRPRRRKRRRGRQRRLRRKLP